MRQFTMRTVVPGNDVAGVYQRLSDFAAYPQYATSVRTVRVRHEDLGAAVSDWEVDFRGGILRWTEEDEFFPDEARMTFRQLTGDLEVFTGVWQVEADPEGTAVVFTTRFDLGIPTLEEVLEPIAEEALYENVESILSGLFGADVRVVSSSGEAVTDGMELASR